MIGFAKRATYEGLSGITWGGFDNFYYLFTFEDTRDAFGIPHDIRILEEVCYETRCPSCGTD
jgi:tRNA(Arg) A34 adenosine deaminase TadA